jgi:hypothetical protein
MGKDLKALDVDKASQMIWYSTYFKGLLHYYAISFYFIFVQFLKKYEVKEYE